MKIFKGFPAKTDEVYKRKVQMTKVIRAPWNALLDYEIPLKRAKELFDEGKLIWDSTNGAYSSYLDWEKRYVGDRIE